MVFSIEKLNKVLPIIDLGTDEPATIYGFSPREYSWGGAYSFYLKVPPAGWREMFIEPVEALTQMLEYKGLECDQAENYAKFCCSGFESFLPATTCVRFYEWYGQETFPHIPVSVFTQWLRENHLMDESICDYLDKCNQLATTSVAYRGYDERTEKRTIANFPDFPPPEALYVHARLHPLEGHLHIDYYLNWREEIRDAVKKIEKFSEASVYLFGDPEDPINADGIHRYLFLHMLCSLIPDHPYVKFILRASGAVDLEDLKKQLINPEIYQHPLSPNDGFAAINTDDYMDFTYPDLSEKRRS